MTVNTSNWPPFPYSQLHWPDHWLRIENEYPGSNRPSLLAAHATVPYQATFTDDEVFDDTLGQIASHYLGQLHEYLKKHPDDDGPRSLDLPNQWNADFNFQGNADDEINWLKVWPAVPSGIPTAPPHVASWNLSRKFQHGLPATIIMVATEVLNNLLDLSGSLFGLRVPMLLEKDNDIFTVTIRSAVVEYPPVGKKSWSALAQAPFHVDETARKRGLTVLIREISNPDSVLRAEIGAAASVVPNSIKFEDVLVPVETTVSEATQPAIIEMISKARGSKYRFPNPLSYQVVSKLRLDFAAGNVKLLQTETRPLVTNMAQGDVIVFPQVPPASPKPADPQHPNADYDWSMRRPSRSDDILERFGELVNLGNGADKALLNPGFNICLCPEYVPEDFAQAQNGGVTKIAHLPTNADLPPRRNEFSAISAYINSSDFFEMLAAFGLDPKTFVVRAETDIQIYYRYGITPGPGSDGKTVNAQVAFDCKPDGGSRPPIRMNLALANLSRWSHPKTPQHKLTFAQPLGIAMDKRWMLHEFGHYLLAARIGKLEFDFAHSAGDALAAIACDPASRLADQNGGLAESFRGVTYPFVFSTRRHDRSPSLGWAWYGALNRAIVANPPGVFDVTKGYLTEQILSSSLFRLYRALGGDTTKDGRPDIYMRERASFLTLFLLIRAIAGFAQSPSKAEMLELGMEEAGLLLGGELEMVPQPTFAAPAPQPDGWKGGMTHKVVRWAFETQGMFPEVVTTNCNDMGKPPPVDVYITDRRPAEEVINGNRFVYGKGSFCPVSLDWAPGALWMAGDTLTVGNRGSQIAKKCTVRRWLGFMIDDPTENWGLTASITWFVLAGIQHPDIPGHQSGISLTQDGAEVEIAQAQALGATSIVILFELSCPDDRANTDLGTKLATAASTVDDLPQTARALCDLVACDNNLGLMRI